MKKILVFAALLIYSITSFGISLHYFYCCGKLKSVSFKPVATNVSGTENCKKGCCENSIVTVKLNTDQKSTSTSTYNFFASEPQEPTTSSYENVRAFISENYFRTFYQLPPPRPTIQLFIQLQVFRI